MTFDLLLPPEPKEDLEARIDRLLRDGDYPSREALVTAALDALGRVSQSPIAAARFGDGHYKLDRSWRVVEINDVALDYLGVDRETALASTLWELAPGLLGTECAWHYQAGMAGEASEFVGPSVKRPGRWLEARMFPAADGLEVVLRDVTERVTFEEGLTRTTERLSRLLSAAPIGIIEVDGTGALVYSNPAAERILRLDRGDLLQRSYNSPQWVIEDDEGQPIRDEDLPAAKALRGEHVQGFEHAVRSPDGSGRIYLSVDACPLQGPTGAIEGALALFADITDRKHQDLTLRRSLDRLRLAQNAGHVGLWDWEITTGEVTWSERYREIWDLPEDTRPSFEAFVECFDPADREKVQKDIEAVLSGEGHLETEYRFRDRAGNIRIVSARGEVFRDKSGAPQRMVGIALDVTEQRAAADRQKLLIDELNHRVKNTLATIQSIARQTGRHSVGSAEFTQAFEARLLALSRAHDLLTRESWTGADVLDVVVRALEPYSADAPDRVRYSGPSFRLTPARAVALSLVLHELATNSAKYGSLSAPGGVLLVEWRRIDDGLEIVWEESGGPEVRVPEQRGFGSRLLERTANSELQGMVRQHFLSEGLRCEVVLRH